MALWRCGVRVPGGPPEPAEDGNWQYLGEGARQQMDLIDFSVAGLAILVLLVSVLFIAIIWSAALGSPII